MKDPAVSTYSEEQLRALCGLTPAALTQLLAVKDPVEGSDGGHSKGCGQKQAATRLKGGPNGLHGLLLCRISLGISVPAQANMLNGG